MVLLHSHVHKIFEETKQVYSRKIIKLPNIQLVCVDEERFIKDAEANQMNQILISYGVFDDFAKEYPSFMVVYETDKSSLSYLVRGHHRVSICMPRAQRFLRQFTTQQAYAYLRHGFAHEITHVVESTIVENYKAHDRQLSDKFNSEDLAEQMADRIESSQSYKYTEKKMWEHVALRAEQIKGGIAKYGMDKNDKG